MNKLKFALSLLQIAIAWGFFSAQNVHLDKPKVTLDFESVADLIVVKAQLNEEKSLNFILDTGSNGIIVFDSIYFNSRQLKSGVPVRIRGLGSDSLVNAQVINNNFFKLHPKLYSDKVQVYLLNENDFNLGAKFGKKIDGIVGNDFFRDFILHIFYVNQRLIISNEVCRKSKFEKIGLKIVRNKPFIKIHDTKNNTYTLLMDSGGSDALWLFDEDINWENTPNIRDFLGFGLAGEVIGNRIRKDSITFEGNFFEKMYVAIPDQNYIGFIKELYPNRSGSAGGKFLKKFDWIIDYSNRELYYKRNANFKKEIYYNATGIEVFQPLESIHLYIVESVLKDSAGDLAGLYPDDIIVSINGVKTANLSLDDIYETLNNIKAKKMAITIDRNGRRYNYNVLIKDILNNQ